MVGMKIIFTIWTTKHTYTGLGWLELSLLKTDLVSSVNIRTVITLGSESAERTPKGPTDMFDVLNCSSVEMSFHHGRVWPYPETNEVDL